MIVVDVGTSNSRATVMDVSNGSVIHASSARHQWLHSKKGWSEMEPETVWSAMQAAVSAVLRLLEPKTYIQGMVFSYMGDTLIPVARNGEPLYNMIMAFDGRAGDEAALLSEKVGAAKFADITGGSTSAHLVCSKILWLKRHRESVFRETRYFLSIQQFISQKLGLGHLSDYTLAARKSLFDIKRGAWSEPILDAIGIAAESLNEDVAASTAIVGTIRRFGNVELPHEMPVILGAHDSESCAHCPCISLRHNMLLRIPGQNYRSVNPRFCTHTWAVLGSFGFPFAKNGSKSGFMAYKLQPHPFIHRIKFC